MKSCCEENRSYFSATLFRGRSYSIGKRKTSGRGLHLVKGDELNGHSQLSPVILLRGPKFSGKSLFVERLAARLSGEGIRVTGFFQRGVFDEAGRKKGHDLVLLPNGESRPIARRSGKSDEWSFFDEAFALAAESIDEDAEVCVIDEIGRLELKREGHFRVFEHAMKLDMPLIIVVREKLADDVVGILGDTRPVREIRHVESEIDTNVSRIVSLIRRSGNDPG